MDTVPRGVFATRAPARPNPIGLSIVELEKVDGNRLYIQQADMLDGTPLLDIKTFVPGFEPSGNVRIGWLEDKIEQLNQVRDDGRFTK
jgi:tRNA (Thr-GGU) A37 N-methylase